MRAVLDIVLIVLDAFIWLLIIQAVLSWLLAFNVVNSSNQVVSTIWRFCNALTEPLLRPIRRVVPALSGVDLSSLVLILGVILVQRVIIYYVYPAVI
ncbi:MAG: YggT family protein [Caulobacterales bacterium]